MKGYQLVEEAKNHFVLQSPNGAKVKIAKNGLTPATMQKIQGMAEGGKVEYAVSKENTLNTDAADAFKKAFNGAQSVDKPKSEPKKIAQVAQYADGGLVNEEAQQPQGQKPVDININVSGQQPAQSQQEPNREPQGMMDQAGDAAKAIGSAVMSAGHNAIGAISKMAQSPIGKALITGDTAHLAPPQAEIQPAVDTGGTPQASSRNALAGGDGQPAQPDMMQQVNALQNTPSPGESKAMQEYLGIGKQQIAALDNEKIDSDKIVQNVMGPNSPETVKINAAQTRYDQINTDLESLRKQAAEFKFEPKTMFSGKNVLQSIGTALSVLAGGVSQGLTGAKTNPVVDYIDRQLDLDFQKQKQDFGKIDNQYTILRQRGLNEAESMNIMKARQYTAVQVLLKQKELQTKNTLTKLELQKAQAAMAMQAQTFAKQAAIESTVRSNLTGGSTGTQSGGGMLPINNTQGGSSAPATSSANKSEKWKIIAQSVPMFVKDEKLIPKVAEEIQRLTDAHEGADTLLELFDKAAANRRNFGNVLNENGDISSLRQNLIPFIKAKEGAPREFEAHTAEKLFPVGWDSDENIQKKRKGWIRFMETGSTSSLLDTQRIPYPKLKLGGRQLK